MALDGPKPSTDLAQIPTPLPSTARSLRPPKRVLNDGHSRCVPGALGDGRRGFDGAEGVLFSTPDQSHRRAFCYENTWTLDMMICNTTLIPPHCIRCSPDEAAGLALSFLRPRGHDLSDAPSAVQHFKRFIHHDQLPEALRSTSTSKKLWHSEATVDRARRGEEAKHGMNRRIGDSGKLHSMLLWILLSFLSYVFNVFRVVYLSIFQLCTMFISFLPVHP